MTQVSDFYAGQKVTLVSQQGKAREAIWDELGGRAIVVDLLDNVALIHMEGDDDGAFMVRLDELEPPKDKDWKIGEVVEFTHDFEDKLGEIITPCLFLDGVIKYGVEVDGVHLIVPVSDFVS